MLNLLRIISLKISGLFALVIAVKTKMIQGVRCLGCGQQSGKPETGIPAFSRSPGF